MSDKPIDHRKDPSTHLSKQQMRRENFFLHGGEAEPREHSQPKKRPETKQRYEHPLPQDNLRERILANIRARKEREAAEAQAKVEAEKAEREAAQAKADAEVAERAADEAAAQEKARAKEEKRAAIEAAAQERAQAKAAKRTVAQARIKLARTKPIIDTQKEIKPRQQDQKQTTTKPETKITLKFPGDIKGSDLLAYARKKGITFGGLLEEIRGLSGDSQNIFAQMLELDRSQYRKFVHNEQKKPPLPMMNRLADILGAKVEDDKVTEENRAQWRQFMLGIPAEINQEKVNHCLDNGSPINTDHTGFGHRIALAKFFTLLANRHGLVEWTQLARAIAAHAGMDQNVTIQLQRAMDSRAGPQENAELDPSQIETERLHTNDDRSIIMPLADIIAEFAFPDDKSRQKACLEFLTSDKYLTSKEDEMTHRSEGIRNAQKARRHNWGRRIGGENGEATIETGR